MNKIREFLSLGSGYGDGDGSGSGYGYGSGYGDGSGYGYGSGSGYGYGSGYGDGSGYGYGSGYGDGSGSGSGSGSGYGFKSINGLAVYYVDETPTVFYKIKGNVAKGAILRGDMTLEPCWIVKGANCFAHGETLHKAREALLEKMFEDMPEDERIAAFVEAHKPGVVYPDKDYFDWHHRLTGSCEMGRMAFARDHGLESLEGSRTPEEFIALCENSYGGSVIKKLREYYPELLKGGDGDG